MLLLLGNNSDLIIYFSSSQITGFYDQSSNTAFLIDSSTLLIIDVQNGQSIIIYLSSTTAYYYSGSSNANVSSGIYNTSTNIITYFESVQSLTQVLQIYAQYGQSVNITSSGEIVGSNAAEQLYERFLRRTLGLRSTVTLVKLRLLIQSLVSWSASVKRSPGIFEVSFNGQNVLWSIVRYLTQSSSSSSNSSSSSSSNSSSSNQLEDFLKILSQLGSNSQEISSIFKDGNLINQLIGSNGSPQLVGFLRFFEIFASFNDPNNISRYFGNGSPLNNIPGLREFLHLFSQNGGHSGLLNFGFDQLSRAIPGLGAFLQNLRNGAESADGLAKAIFTGIHQFTTLLSGISKIPFNPFGPFIGGFAGGLDAVAGQGSNIEHIVSGVLGLGGNQSSSEENRHSRVSRNKRVV